MSAYKSTPVSKLNHPIRSAGKGEKTNKTLLRYSMGQNIIQTTPWLNTTSHTRHGKIATLQQKPSKTQFNIGLLTDPLTLLNIAVNTNKPHTISLTEATRTQNTKKIHVLQLTGERWNESERISSQKIRNEMH